MNPEPAIARMKERDLDRQRERERERERQNETKRKNVICPVKFSTLKSIYCRSGNVRVIKLSCFNFCLRIFVWSRVSMKNF